jgi:hypothetical protein
MTTTLPPFHASRAPLTRSVCTLQELLLKLVEDYYPMPADPDADVNAAQKPAASKGRARRPDARPSRRVCLMNASYLHAYRHVQRAAMV